jgi:hypothetical protein
VESGYHAGTGPELDRAIELVPRIFEVTKQSPMDEPRQNAFQEVAAALKARTPPQAPVAPMYRRSAPKNPEHPPFEICREREDDPRSKYSVAPWTQF